METIAQRVEALFTRWGQLSNREAARRVKEAGGSISHSQVGNIRSGRQPCPAVHHLQMLANLFEVPMSYFFDPGPVAEVLLMGSMVTSSPDMTRLVQLGMTLSADRVATLVRVAQDLQQG
jgi:hypothetical protein